MNKKTIERLESIYKLYKKNEQRLLCDEVIKDVTKMTEIMKEQANLKDIFNAYSSYKAQDENIKESEELINSDEQELIQLGKEEIKKSEALKKDIEDELKILLLPKDENDKKNVIVEIHGAAGGDEGNIFAGDLFKMYLKYAEKQNWNSEIIEISECQAGGYSSITFILKGMNVYSKMKFESGAHRVQRVPKTESKGRVHTSTATVAVLPEVDEVEVKINNADLKIDTYRASGAGGQHVNTTDSAVRITHIPTGTVVTSQDGRSQHDNKALAMQHLRSKIFEEQLRKQNDEMSMLRKQAIGTGDRSEKIRTYNYPQNRVTDHRIGISWNRLDYIIEGDLESIMIALINNEQRLIMEGNL